MTCRLWITEAFHRLFPLIPSLDIIIIIILRCETFNHRRHFQFILLADLEHSMARPSHLHIPDGPIMARAALRRRAIDGPLAVMYRKSGAMPVYFLEARRATYGPYAPRLDGPFRQAKSGPSQMRRPVYGATIIRSRHRSVVAYILNQLLSPAVSKFFGCYKIVLTTLLN